MSREIYRRFLNPRRLLAVLLAFVSLFGLTLLGAGPAAADGDEVGPYNPPPPVYGNGPCNPFAVGTFYTNLRTPDHINEGIGPSINGPLRGNIISSEGSIVTSDNTSCAHAQVQFLLESKYCNRFGWYCHWRPIYQTDWALLPVSGELHYPLSGSCRSGVDSYRTTALVAHAELDFEQTPSGAWVPYLESKNQALYSDVVKLDCG